MAQYNRPPRPHKEKESEKPDQFLGFFDRVVLYFHQHRNKLFLLIAAFILALAGYGVYLFQLDSQYDKLASSYYQAEQAKDDKALETWVNFLKLNPPARLTEIANIQLGGIEAKNNRWREASEYFQKASGSTSPILRSLAELAWATSLENAKDYTKAKELYQKMANGDSLSFKNEAKLGLARCLVELNQKDEAKKLLEELTAKDSSADPSLQSAALAKLLAMKLTESSS